MAAEPSEEAIANFISFTSTSREQAVKFLKANDLNSQKAINAYFEDPTGPLIEETNYYAGQNVPSFKIEHDDHPVQGPAFVAPPSRPPSRTHIHDSAPATTYEGVPAPAATVNTEQGLSLAEREERDLQQAVAMSLNQNLGRQETGVTSASQSNFGRATRDDYDDNEWAMTLFNASAREIVISPDPEDRKRVTGEPAFLRPSQEGLYLGGLLTILHSIPFAREALLLRDHMLSNYGHDPQWWNGQPIHLPKIVTIHDTHGLDSDHEDVLHETQRLMAFLDSTERAFGSADALASLKCMSSSYDSEGSVGRFLETWQAAAGKAAPGNQLAAVFSSRAFKRPLSVYDTPIGKDFFTIDPFVESDHGQTLYDVLDRTIWADKPGEEIDDVWLEHVAEVFTIKLEPSDMSAKSGGVKVPPIFYPDRYMDSCRDLSREFRTRRLQIYEEVSKLEYLMSRFTASKAVAQKGLTSRETLEKAASSALSKNFANAMSETSLTPEAANAEAQRLANELRSISGKIEEKLKELELRRTQALETLRNYSKFLTDPPASPTEAPRYRYTLRGVCTEPHVTYILRRHVPDDPENAMDSDSKQEDDWQWWRISFSTDDAKTRRAERDASKSGKSDYTAPQNADVVGYTSRKVREIEVLRAAREESRSVLLVYASNRAMDIPESAVPPPLQRFVSLDNEAFETEFREAANGQDIEQQTGDQEVNTFEGRPGESPVDSGVYFDAQAQSNPSSEQQNKISSGESTRPNVNVFDYEVSSFEEEPIPRQEMQERGGVGLLGKTPTVEPPSYTGPKWEEMDENDHVNHIEYAK